MVETLQKIIYVELAAKINRARAMDVNAIPHPVIQNRIHSIMDGYHTVVIKAAMNGLYRARENTSEQPFLSASDLWYPPAPAIRFRGRFNEPGVPVFYASNRPNGAALEVRPAVGDVITLLVIRTRKPFVELNSAQIGLDHSSAPELGRAQRARMLRNNPNFQDMLRRHGINNKWLLINEFLSEIATTPFSPEQEQSKYIITNAIADLLFKIPGVRALNYPSVATRLHCLNICLKPNVADQHFIPSHAWMIRIEEPTDRLPGVERPGIYYRTSFIRRTETIAEDGKLRWSEPLTNVRPEEVSNRFYQLPLENSWS